MTERDLNGEPPIDLHWDRFGLKIVLWLVWMITAVPFYQGMVQPDLFPPLRLVLGSLFVAPILVWVWSARRRLNSGDEFEQRLAIRGLAQGASFSVIWVGLVQAGYMVLEVIGLIAPRGAAGHAGMIAVLAPMAMAISESFVQCERVNYVKSAKTSR